MVQNLILDVVQTTDVFSVHFWFAHVDCVCYFLGFLLLGVELDVPCCNYKVIYLDGYFGSLDANGEVAIVSELLSQRSFFGFPYLAENFLDIARRKRGSASHGDFSLHQVEKIFRFQAWPGLSFYRVFHDSEKHFSCHSIVEADLCQPSAYVLSDLFVCIGCDNYEGPGFSAYYLVEPAV